MDPSQPAPREVPVDVLPPVPHDAGTLWSKPGEPPFSKLRTFYHPASGVVVLGIDSLFFVSEFFSGFLALPVMCVLAFLITFPLVFLIQKKWGARHSGRGLWKGVRRRFPRRHAAADLGHAHRRGRPGDVRPTASSAGNGPAAPFRPAGG